MLWSFAMCIRRYPFTISTSKNLPRKFFYKKYMIQMNGAILLAKIQWMFKWKRYKMYIKMMTHERIFVQHWPFVHPVATGVKYSSCSSVQKVLLKVFKVFIWVLFSDYTPRIHITTQIEQLMMMPWQPPHKRPVMRRFDAKADTLVAKISIVL